VHLGDEGALLREIAAFTVGRDKKNNGRGKERR